MYTVPNQNLIKIHREKPHSDFLQIKNSNWQRMIKETQDYYAFALYLYFCSNADNYTFALSPAAITEAIGLPRSTYYKKYDILKEKGYIREDNNLIHFYEVSQKRKNDCGGLPCRQGNLPQRQENLPERLECLPEKQANLPERQNCSSGNIEIDNRYSTDKINNIDTEKIIESLLEEPQALKEKEKDDFHF